MKKGTVILLGVLAGFGLGLALISRRVLAPPDLPTPPATGEDEFDRMPDEQKRLLLSELSGQLGDVEE